MFLEIYRRHPEFGILSSTCSSNSSCTDFRPKGLNRKANKLILTIFGNLRDFFLKYFDGLKKNAQIDKMNMKDIQIVENNIEFIC